MKLLILSLWGEHRTLVGNQNLFLGNTNFELRQIPRVISQQHPIKQIPKGPCNRGSLLPGLSCSFKATATPISIIQKNKYLLNWARPSVTCNLRVLTHLLFRPKLMDEWKKEKESRRKKEVASGPLPQLTAPVLILFLRPFNEPIFIMSFFLIYGLIFLN